MKFIETALAGAYVIEPQRYEDRRGFFARSFCEKDFAEHGLCSRMVQSNISYNRRKGTLRGMHRQLAPHQEAKLVRCTYGGIYDVIVDLRPGSATYAKWIGTQLTSDDRKLLYVPEYFAHGFITLVDETEVAYQVSQYHAPQSEWGARYDDPAFGIKWPIPVEVLSDKDERWPAFVP